MKKQYLSFLKIAIPVMIIIIGLVLYYQSQGVIKLFPNKEEKAIEHALEINENKFKIVNGLSQEDFEKKIKELYAQKNKVLENKTSSDEWMLFGNQLEFLNDHEGAIRAWEMVNKIQPYDFRALYNLAFVNQYFLKQFDKAENYYLEVLKLQPDYANAYSGLIDLYRFNQKEKNNKLEPLILTAIQKDGANKAQYYYILVEFFSAEGTKDIEKAKTYLQSVKDLDLAKADELLETYPFLK